VIGHITVKEISLLLQDRCKPELTPFELCSLLLFIAKCKLLAVKPNSSKLISQDQFDHRFGQTRNEIRTAHVIQDSWSLSYYRASLCS